MKEDNAAVLRARGAGEPDAEEVRGYLARHPEFFLDHEQLLCELHLPHHAGEAVSLIERQVSLLRERNIASRQRLTRLLETARDNDLLFARTRRLILALLEAQTLPQLQRGLIESLRHDFAVDHGRLLLLERSPERWPGGIERIEPAFAEAALGAVLRSGRPLVGALRVQERALLFGPHAEEVQSAVVIALGPPDAPFALLAAGSDDPRRFQGEMGTLFLEFIGDVLQRLLPRFALQA